MAVANAKNPNFLKRHMVITWALIVIALLILLVPGYFIYEKVALELNRRAFIKARQAIDVAYSDITTQVGQPYTHASTNSCSRGFIDSWTQVTSCSVDITFKYKVASQQESDNLDQKIVSIVNTSKYLKPAPAPDNHTQVTLVPGAKPDTSIHWYKSPGGILCAYNHSFGSGEETVGDYNNMALKANDFYASLSCTDNARQTYYPLNQG